MLSSMMKHVKNAHKNPKYKPLIQKAWKEHYKNVLN